MKAKHNDLVMAFYPNARGFAYVIFEGPFYLVDWGTSDVQRRQRRTHTYLCRLSILIDRYHPDILVLRDGSDSRGSPALPALTRATESLAEGKGVATCRFSRKEIQQAFVHLGSPTRYTIAEAIASQIPALEWLLPPPRKIWNGEDRRMGLFDAAALALALFTARHGEPPRRQASLEAHQQLAS